ncbi:hypothetical protein N7530_004314 [Penicillium desertorum]|uniref:Uncharacterized protein n=1 Tax=Penicillium desertorum TaxID=1303715 RepID=A0A9X0BQB2_9EURO|nr:hypothetical protein N7530_004314 [Penicillium desertorum]
MPFTELVVLTLKTDPVTEAIFTTEVAPFLITILDIYTTPKSKYFGKILLENGNDMSGDFRLCVGLEWEDASHFITFVVLENFRTFKSIVKPHSITPLYLRDESKSKGEEIREKVLRSAAIKEARKSLDILV